jgi:hypothetical protein
MFCRIFSNQRIQSKNMQIITDRKAAAILGWMLSPLALLNVYVLYGMVLVLFEPDAPWSLGPFIALYMLPALGIWVLLLVVAHSHRNLLFIRFTWGAHVGFNVFATLLWLRELFTGQEWASLYAMPVTILVLIYTTSFFLRSFTLNSNLN